MARVKTAHDVVDELVDRQGADLGRRGGIHDDSSPVVGDNPYYAASMPTFLAGLPCYTLNIGWHLAYEFRVISTQHGTIHPMDSLILADLVTNLPDAVRLQRIVHTLRHRFRSDAVGLLKLDEGSLRLVAAAGIADDALGRRFAVAEHPRF